MPTGIGTLVFVTCVCLVVRDGTAECDIVGSELHVPAGTTCSLSADVAQDGLAVRVSGTVTVTVPVIHVTCASFEIESGGRVIAEPVSSEGPGTGNSLGSGGTHYIISRSLC